MTRKRGRHAKHYRTSWGELIEGLMLRADGRFCPVGRGNVSFGRDERLAIHRFRKWQQEQGLDVEQSVTFDTIRDGAYTAAIEAGADITQARLLAGHKVGMADHYVRRNPRMVADCCAAIEEHYFA